MIKKHRLHHHPKKEQELVQEIGMFEYIVDAEFKDLFRTYKELPNDPTHVVVYMCEYFELTEPQSHLGDVIRTGTKVKVISCEPHPEYVGMIGTIAIWITPTESEEDALYGIEVDGELLEGYANRMNFEVINTPYISMTL